MSKVLRPSGQQSMSAFRAREVVSVLSDVKFCKSF